MNYIKKFLKLNRIDKDIDEIISSAKYCCLYEYDGASKIWHACETTGPLFIVKTKN